MTVPDDIEARILEKASYVEEAISVLASKRKLDKQTYLDDREQRAIVEREYQTAIEACLDIAGLLIRTVDRDAPDTYAERFAILNDADVLSAETSGKMQRAAGFRNILVHQYGNDIDDTEVFEHLQTELTWIVRFLREVKEYMEGKAE